MKRIIPFILILVLLVCALSIPVSAKGTSWVQMSRTSTSYGVDIHKMYGQNCAQKSITVGKGKTVKISAELGCFAKNYASAPFAPYVRFALWVYDINTGVRVVNTTIKADEKYTLPIDKTRARYYSVQIRPYMHSSAWKKFSTFQINAYLALPTSEFRLNY